MTAPASEAAKARRSIAAATLPTERLFGALVGRGAAAGAGAGIGAGMGAVAEGAGGGGIGAPADGAGGGGTGMPSAAMGLLSLSFGAPLGAEFSPSGAG